MYNRDKIPACDRRTDRRTSCDGIVRTMHTRRTVKTCGKSNVKTLAVLWPTPKILAAECFAHGFAYTVALCLWPWAVAAYRHSD